MKYSITKRSCKRTIALQSTLYRRNPLSNYIFIGIAEYEQEKKRKLFYSEPNSYSTYLISYTNKNTPFIYKKPPHDHGDTWFNYVTKSKNELLYISICSII